MALEAQQRDRGEDGLVEIRPRARSGSRGPVNDQRSAHAEDPLRTFLDELHIYRPPAHRSFVDAVRAAVLATTDKVYEQAANGPPCREGDRLGGSDPYSASKACAEVVASSYRNCVFTDKRLAIATARAGNVFGGGDWSADRLIPDAARAFSRGESLSVRNPESVRPWPSEASTRTMNRSPSEPALDTRTLTPCSLRSCSAQSLVG